MAESFEAALAELSRIVGELEEGSLGLEQSLTRFEQGMQLLRYCHGVLEGAEQKIEQVVGFDADGNFVTAAFDASATAADRGESAGRRTRTRPASDGPPEAASPEGPRLF
jgi:exodeoxyribonuclease VII small subunit